MSYANPKQYIDNQSTQIQLNLQKTLSDITSKTVSDIGKIYAENSKFNKQLIQQVDNKINKQTSAAIQTHGKNPSVKMGEIYKLSKYVGDLKKSDPTSWTEKQRTTISSWDTLADRMQNTFENTLSADPGGALSNNADKPGGIDTKRGREKTHVLLAMANLVPSQKISQFPLDETGFINYNILVKDGETDIGNVINDTPESTMQLDIVPDILKSIEVNNKIFAGKLDINNPLSPYYTVTKKDGEEVEYKDPLTNQVILRGRYMDIEKVKKDWIAGQEANDYTGLENTGKVSLYETQYKDKNDPSYNYDDATDAELKIMKDKYLDKEFNIFLAKNPNIYKALANPKAAKPDTPPVKKISAATKIYNAQVKLADASIKDMNELMKTPLKEIGNRPFTLDEAGAFMQVVNKHRKAKGGKIKSMDEIKANFLKEKTLEDWDAKGITAELGYVRESNGNKYIEQLPVGSYEQKTETLVDLLYPNLETTKRNEMLNFIRGIEGETTSKANKNRPELP